MSQYTAEDIEVLTGLEPVRKRPGMYTDTARPNHLAQEVIDNSVDEALAGHADQVDVVLHKDGSLSVTDNGRGMPVDVHPEQGKPGVEVILSTLHAGGKFSSKNYQFSGGLHGVGVSVVNALSSELTVTEVLRLDQFLCAAPAACAARQGGALSRVAGPVQGREERRERGVVLRGRPDRLPRRCHRRFSLHSRGALCRQFCRLQ